MRSVPCIILRSNRIEKTNRNTLAYPAVPSSSHTAAAVAAVVEPSFEHSAPPGLGLGLALAPGLELEQLVGPAQRPKPG